jgi:hypothetical protein
MGRVLVGGLVGGIVFFLWGFVSHVVLPVGQMGIRSLPNEEPVLAAMREQIREPGLYFFPGMDMSRKLSDAEQKAWEEKYRTGPYGILVYHPNGEQPMSGRQLGTQFGTDVVCALLIALLVSMTAVGYAGRVAASVLTGVFAWVSISVPHWNWYGFPTAFALGEGIDAIVACLLGGLVIAWIVKGRQTA